MSRALLRRSVLALRRAMEAQSIELQTYHAEEARLAFAAARRSAEASPAEQRALEVAAHELADFEAHLRALEDRIARAKGGGT